MPSYSVFDALCGYDLQHWRLALNLRNLRNKTDLNACSAGSGRCAELRKVVATATCNF